MARESCSGQKFLSRKKLSRKCRSIFASKISPATGVIQMWIICLDPVSANSEKGRGSEWAVRVGQRLPSRFGQSGAALKMNLKLSWKRRQLGGVCQALSRHSLFLAGAARSVLVDYRDSSDSSRRCAVWARHWMRCSAVACPVAPFLRCFWSLCLGCKCT